MACWDQALICFAGQHLRCLTKHMSAGEQGPVALEATVRVLDMVFFRKVVLRHDTGLGEAYMDGDFEVPLLSCGRVVRACIWGCLASAARCPAWPMRRAASQGHACEGVKSCPTSVKWSAHGSSAWRDPVPSS